MNQTLFSADDIRTIVIEKELRLQGAWASVTGLRKVSNEDILDCWSTQEQSVRICLCDGHWGNDAAVLARDYFFRSSVFPQNRHEAIESLSFLEGEIDRVCGVPGLDGVHDTTPETSVLLLDISPQKVSIISYGDCRCFVLRKDEHISTPMTATWLGSFSRRGLRHRLPVEQAAYFTAIPVTP
jgi:serine/threonine protein phosphatase PrpC